nr:PD-(D/E)XK nuclease family protein [Natronolimnobius sp. AArcel1]
METVENRVQVLNESKRPPRTFFDVADVSRSESAWQHTLAYFLSPNEPHGFGATILGAFLRLIEEHSESTFEFYEYNLEDIEIQVEASADTGRPDIVLWLEEMWFLCVEIKVDAPETEDQTERYTNASRFGELCTASIPSSGHHFVYLASRHANDPKADKFVTITWQEVVEEFSQHFNPGVTAYPARSVAQLYDFVHHVKQSLNMVNEQGPNSEKVELAFEHSEMINELTDAADQFIKEYQASWDRRFEQDPPSGWTDKWTTIRNGNKWGRLMKADWRLPQNPTGAPQKTSGFSVAISIDVRLEDFERGETEAVFRVYGDNEYTECYLERFHSDGFQDQIQQRIKDTRLTVNESNEPRVLRSVHSFEFNDGEGHLEALKEAFLEYNKVVPHLEELYFEVQSDIKNPDQLFEDD